MNQQDFDNVVAETIQGIQKLLTVKGGEYAGSTDRLANFKRGAELTGCTPLQCLFVYMSKHYDAVATYVKDSAAGVERERSEPISGRLDDLINYCILAKALVQESDREHNNKLIAAIASDVNPTVVEGQVLKFHVTKDVVLAVPVQQYYCLHDAREFGGEQLMIKRLVEFGYVKWEGPHGGQLDLTKKGMEAKVNDSK